MFRAVVVLVLLGGTAHAERWLHAGADVRTDLGTHPARLALGYRACAWDATLVLDPLAVFDGEHGLDLVGEYFVSPRIALLAGLRWTAIAVDGGTHHQERTLVGVTGVGPALFGDALRTAFSFEIATLWVKHGGGAETDWISWDRNLLDHLAAGIFLRIEYALPL